MTFKTLTRLAAAVAATALFSGAALAGDTATVTVSATVVGTCKFASNSASVNLGSLDPSTIGATGASNSVGLIINCTKNTSVATIVLQPVVAAQGTATAGGAASLNGGTYSGTLVSGGNSLPFSMTWPTTAIAGTGFGAGATATANLTLTASVTQAAVQAAAAGSYSSQVQVVITP